ncbi:hypothetical protein RJ035_007045 [Blastomyces gilchristii]
MDTPTIDILETPSEWVAAASSVDVLQWNIFDFRPTELNSGSEIEGKQFLALRALWKSKEAEEFKPAAAWGIALAAYPGLYPIPQVPRGLASLSIVWYYHQLVQGPAAPPHEVPRPNRTIGGLNQCIQKSSQLLNKEHRSILYPDIENEQIVNTHLIDLFTSLGIICKITNCQWNISRKVFRVQKEVQTTQIDEQSSKPVSVVKKALLFETRTDGCLWSVDDQLRANVIYWNSSYLSEQTLLRRIMISQSHHEMHITISEYDHDYVDYQSNRPNHE